MSQNNLFRERVTTWFVWSNLDHVETAMATGNIWEQPSSLSLWRGVDCRAVRLHSYGHCWEPRGLRMWRKPSPEILFTKWINRDQPGWRCSWISWVAVAVCCWVAWEVLDPCQLGTQLPRSQGAKEPRMSQSELGWYFALELELYWIYTGSILDIYWISILDIYWNYTGTILELWFDGLCGALWYLCQSFTSALPPCFSEVLVLSNTFGHASGRWFMAETSHSWHWF